MTPTFERLTGRTSDHVVEWGPHAWVHRSARDALSLFAEHAKKAGFELDIASSFRTYSAQQKIWNAKATGKRTLLNNQGEPLEFASLSEDQVLHSILRWSALPGASRHHWGTELDIFPRNLLPENQRAQLIPQEIAPGGIFASFGQWLDSVLPLEGFYRPYREDLGGVSPEWWHISYAPVATGYLDAYDLPTFLRSLDEGDIELEAQVRSQAEKIYHRYFLTVAPVPPDAAGPG